MTSTLSASPSGPSKHPMEDPAVKSDQPADDQSWGRNCENPFLSRQVGPCSDDNWRARPTIKTSDQTNKWTPDLTHTIMTSDQTIRWTPDLTQTIETLRIIRLHIDQQRIVKDIRYKLDGNDEMTLGLDSHADTCVLGCNALIILDYTS